jgi:hypothetical protein
MTALTSPVQPTGTLGRTVLTGELSVLLPDGMRQTQAVALLELVRPIVGRYATYCQTPRLTRYAGRREIVIAFKVIPWRTQRRLEDALIEATDCRLGCVYQLQRLVTA